MSNIEWCDVTWNPVRGCTRVSEGCRSGRFQPGVPRSGESEDLRVREFPA